VNEPGWWQASDGRFYPPEQHPLHQKKKPTPNTDALIAIIAVLAVGALIVGLRAGLGG
jgi:hypothetical protein